MAGPTWLNWPFAGLMGISALYCAGRMVAARQHGRTGGYDIDLTHLVILHSDGRDARHDLR